MTAPRARADRLGDPDRLLDRLLALAERIEKDGRAGELADDLAALHAGLATGEMALPRQWAAATPPPAEAPADADAEVQAAAEAVSRAEAALEAAEQAAQDAITARGAAARALGEARKTFYDLARVRDLSRA